MTEKNEVVDRSVSGRTFENLPKFQKSKNIR